MVDQLIYIIMEFFHIISIKLTYFAFFYTFFENSDSSNKLSLKRKQPCLYHA